tara:strand:- start:612 stop:1667 length:1056 start_codon:yes stop_codon:yes gene_type:complete
MKIGFLKDLESRVSLTPPAHIKYVKSGYEVSLEKGAGLNSGYLDEDYECKKYTRSEVIKNSDIIICVDSSSLREIDKFNNKTLISNFSGEKDIDKLKDDIRKNNIRAFDLSKIPRTTIAQSMDILSSMSGLSGYKSVIKAAEILPKMFPMMITAAGSIKPVKVVVLGAGVAGLQAIATAKRLGAVVEASDPRQAAKEEVLSLGAKFIEVEGAVEDNDAGGYAVKQTQEFLDRQKQEVSRRLKEADVVITTAQVLGSKSPILISKNVVEQMKPGSVIIDLASSTGGNCELTKDKEITKYNGVSIVGNSFLASELAHDASNLFSNNIFNFIDYIVKDNKFIDQEDDIYKSCKI